MLKRKARILLITILIMSLTIPTYFAFVSSSSGSIRINTTGTSTPGQQVESGGNINLYLKDVIWNGTEFYLLLSQDSTPQMGAGLLYTPAISVYDLDLTTTSNYNNSYGQWLVGNGWVNGTLPAGQTSGNYYVKAVDGAVGSTAAVTDTYLTVTATVYTSTFTVAPSAGPGGKSITFTGSDWPTNSPITITYYDTTFGVWRDLTTTNSDNQGNISVTYEVPDLKQSIGSYDSYSESYTPISFKAVASGIANSSVTTYNEYWRGLKTIGNVTAYGLYGNGSDLTQTVQVRAGDVITISGKWFHSGSPIYIKWDGESVVGTVTGSEWASKTPLQTTAADANGSFTTSITIPSSEAGTHYIAVEDSQSTSVIIKIGVIRGTLSISPSSGPGGATVDFYGLDYPANTQVDLYYYDSSGLYSWQYWNYTTSSSNGTINFTTEIPDLGVSQYSGQYSNNSYTLSFKSVVNGTSYAYVDYYQYGRGLSQVGTSVPYVLYGNGTDLSTSVNKEPGDSLYIEGRYFHPGIVYIRFDGTSPTGQSIIATEWGSSIAVGSTTASQSGSFATTITIPEVDDGVHSIAIEDSEASLIINIYVTNDNPSPTPTPKPTTSSSSSTTSPTTSPTRTPSPSLPTPTIDLTCKGTSTSSRLQAEISGELHLNGQAVASSPIVLTYSKNGGTSWESLTMVNTNSEGKFSAEWYPDATGNYLIKATSSATSSMNAASKTVNLALDKNAADNTVFTVNSNSTITEFAFNSTSNQLSFLVSGEEHTTGYVEIYVPKSLVSDISQLTAYKDGQQITFSSQSQGDSWIITFTYSHSQHQIILAISGQTATAPAGNLDILFYAVPIAVIAVIIVAIAVFVMKRKKA